MAGFRTALLTLAGGSVFARAWANAKCKPYGVKVIRTTSGVELRKGTDAILLAPKHIFYAPEIAAAFEAYAHALPTAEYDAVSTANFAVFPEAIHTCRRSLHAGVVIEARDGTIWLHKDQQALILSQAHFVYVADIAETFDRYFLPLVPDVVDGIEVLDYSKPGKLQTFRGSGLQFEMASFPEEEDELEESFHWYRPKAGDLVYEIGAHCGVSTYHFAKMVGPEGRVIAFEPDPINVEILRRNMERYNLTNVTIVNAAVAGESGQLLFSSEGSVGSMLMSVLGRPPAGPVVKVEAMTLADAFSKWGVPDFCKVDIEGSEIDVIAKSAELLKAHKTNFALDTCHLKADGQSTHTDVEALFRSYGYDVESEAKPLMATWARPK